MVYVQCAYYYDIKQLYNFRDIIRFVIIIFVITTRNETNFSNLKFYLHDEYFTADKPFFAPCKMKPQQKKS